eukprot:1629643-Prymnesium_polylepis.2
MRQLTIVVCGDCRLRVAVTHRSGADGTEVDSEASKDRRYTAEQPSCARCCCGTLGSGGSSGNGNVASSEGGVAWGTALLVLVDAMRLRSPRCAPVVRQPAPKRCSQPHASRPRHSLLGQLPNAHAFGYILNGGAPVTFMSANVCLPQGSRAARRWCSDLDMLSYDAARSAAAAAAASVSRHPAVANSAAAARSSAPAASAAPAAATSHALRSCSAASSASSGIRRAGPWMGHVSGHGLTPFSRAAARQPSRATSHA